MKALTAPCHWPASLAFSRRNSPHKWPVTREMFPFDHLSGQHGLQQLPISPSAQSSLSTNLSNFDKNERINTFQALISHIFPDKMIMSIISIPPKLKNVIIWTQSSQNKWSRKLCLILSMLSAEQTKGPGWWGWFVRWGPHQPTADKDPSGLIPAEVLH